MVAVPETQIDNKKARIVGGEQPFALIGEFHNHGIIITSVGVFVIANEVKQSRIV